MNNSCVCYINLENLQKKFTKEFNISYYCRLNLLKHLSLVFFIPNSLKKKNI